MECRSCFKKFDFFRKSVSCPICNFILCKQCCSQKNPKNESQLICLSCLRRMTNENSSQLNIPKAFIDMKIRNIDSKNQALHAQSELAKLEERLESIKTREINDKKADTEARLDRLNSTDGKNSLPNDAIESRLNRLISMNDTKPHTETKSSDPVDDIISRLKDAARLELKHGITIEDESKYEIYCELCTSLAQFTCEKCDGIFFCETCYDKVHRNLKKHNKTPIETS